MAQKLNTRTSVVDYLKSTGKNSSFGSRSKLANQYGIKGYTGTAQQNVLLLNKLRGGGSSSKSTGKGKTTGKVMTTGGKTGKSGKSSSGSVIGQAKTTVKTGVNAYNKSLNTAIDTTQKALDESKAGIDNQLQTSNEQFKSDSQGLIDKQIQYNDTKMDGLKRYLTDASNSALDSQLAGYQRALDQRLTEVAKAYDQAVADGEMSVREAEDAYNEQKSAIEEQAYLDAQATNLSAEDRGIANSQQMSGMQASDNSRKQTMLNSNMTARDKQIADIQERISNITKQKDLDIADANSEFNYNSTTARSQADQNLANQIYNMEFENSQNISNQMFDIGKYGLARADSLNNMQLSNLYNQQNMAQGNLYNLQNTGINNQFQQNMANQQQVNTLTNMGVQQGYDLQKMGVQQNYDLEKMDVQQKHTLEQMAKSFGYDLKKMNVQQRYTLDQMAKAYGYDLGKMKQAQIYTKENNAILQGYTQQNMATEQAYNVQNMATQNSYNAQADERAYNNQSRLNEQQSNLRLKEEKASYNRAIERELNKYKKGTREYRVNQGQMQNAVDSMIAGEMSKAQITAVIKNELTPVEKPILTGKGVFETKAHQKKEEKQFKKDMEAYKRYILFSTDPIKAYNKYYGKK